LLKLWCYLRVNMTTKYIVVRKIILMPIKLVPPCYICEVSVLSQSSEHWKHWMFSTWANSFTNKWHWNLSKLWNFLRVNMTNPQLLLKLWSYLRDNMTNHQLLLTLWYYLSHVNSQVTSQLKQ
jgi:hypothetical protein